MLYMCSKIAIVHRRWKDVFKLLAVHVGSASKTPSCHGLCAQYHIKNYLKFEFNFSTLQ